MPVKRLIALLFLVANLSPAITTIQSHGCPTTGTSPGSFTCTFATNVASGHGLYVSVGSVGGAGTGSVTDTLGNSYSEIVNHGGPANSKIEGFVAYSSRAAGADTITVTQSAQYFNIIIVEYSTALILDTTNFCDSGSSGTNCTLTATIAKSNELIIVSGNAQNGGTWSISPSTGWTTEQTVTNAGFFGNTLVLYDSTTQASGALSELITSSAAPIEGSVVAFNSAPAVSKSFIF